jgi:hypothetical protein
MVGSDSPSREFHSMNNIIWIVVVLAILSFLGLR